MSASQCSKKAGIPALFAWIPNFPLFISITWLNSLLNKATHDTCDLHNHTYPKLRPEKNLDRKFWKLEGVVYLGIETDVDRDNCLLINWKLQQPTGHLNITCARGRGTGRGEFDYCLGGGRNLNWKCEWDGGVWRQKKKKKRLFRQIACSARTSKVTHYIRTAFLKVCCIWCIRTRSSVIFL